MLAMIVETRKIVLPPSIMDPVFEQNLTKVGKLDYSECVSTINSESIKDMKGYKKSWLKLMPPFSNLEISKIKLSYL